LSTKIDEYNKEVNGKIIEHSAQIDSLSDKIEIQKIYSNENRKRIDDLRGDHKDLVKTVADNYMNIDKKLELNRTERRDDIKNVRDDLAKGFDSLRKEQDVIIQKKDEKKDAKWNKGIKLAGVLITLISTVFLIISGLIAWGVIK
jgi:hypothetical protein